VRRRALTARFGAASTLVSRPLAARARESGDEAPGNPIAGGSQLVDLPRPLPHL
jgi:hypothetical protein